MLVIDKVTKTYKTGAFGSKSVRAVNEVSFEIDDGEVVSLIGESGSGKSTIGKMILRLLSISKGRILLDGQDISSLKGASLRKYYHKVQGVFQDPFSSYNPVFKIDRIFDNLKGVFFSSLSSKEWNSMVSRALKSVGLNPEDVMGKFPHQLSGGQLQRILISRALLLDVQVLVADEIISMLDASTRVDVLNLLVDLKKTGLSILFITHDLSLGYYLSEKTAILCKGHLVEMGSTERVFFNPVHEYTRKLLNSVPRLDMKWQDVQIPKADVGIEAEIPETYEELQTELIEVEKDHYVAVKRR